MFRKVWSLLKGYGGIFDMAEGSDWLKGPSYKPEALHFVIQTKLVRGMKASNHIDAFL